MPLKQIAYFISPHGFGHAARAAAVMEALSQIDPALQFEIFTSVPSWFFKDSISASYNYHYLVTDVGLVQKNAFQADLEDTLYALKDFFPPSPSLIGEIAETVNTFNCVLIICDIAPLGILVAKETRIPSTLIENFTWDWIYEQYAVSDDRIKQHIDYLQPIFNAVDFRIQTEPVCQRNTADLISTPVSRKIKTRPSIIKRNLGVPANGKMVLITSGGIPQHYGFLEMLSNLRQITFVMPGAGPEFKMVDNLIVLPHRSDFYHPDLVNAADVVIGKVGYSTLSEIYHAGVPFGYIVRSDFRESESLVQFIQKHMPGMVVSESEFSNGDWTAKLSDLLDLAPVKRDITNGAEQIGKFIKDLLS